MIKVTQLQRDNALYARDVMWPAIKPEQVVAGLGKWRCGTQACFGGWCAIDPHFAEQGVRAGRTIEEPVLLPRGYAGTLVAQVLFGHKGLFDSRDCDGNGYCPADEGFAGTDHELVTHRLSWLIENSEAVE